MQTQYVVLILLYILLCTGLWRLFPKAGEKSSVAFIPFYNLYVWLKIIKRPWWWLFLFIVPGVNFLMLAVISVQLAKTFKRKSLLELTFAAVLPYVYFLYVSFDKQLVFTGPEDSTKIPRTALREWTEAIIFAVVAASVIRTFFIEAFTIPTSSLEKTLMVGDYLFVSKLSYGSKVPNTPLSFPFAHHTMPFTEKTKSYLEWIKLPYMRLPGFRDIKNNDIVVFNYPDGDTVDLNHQDQSYYQLCRDFGRNNLWNPEVLSPYDGKPFGSITARPPDKRENYVKRCVAIGGDTLQVKNKVLYINGQKAYYTSTMQFRYLVKTKTGLTKKLLDELDITEAFNYDQRLGGYLMTLSDINAEKLKKAVAIDSIIDLIDEPGKEGFFRGLQIEYKRNMEIFPHSSKYNWNKDNFGPLYLPKEGATIKIDTNNIVLYDRLINIYEGNKLEVKNGKIYINDVASDSYTFKMDYYFMMGDNRHNSADSRYWGMVPADHIVGTPVFIWMSLKDPANNPFTGKFTFKTFFSNDGKARWNRFFTVVRNDGISRSYFIPFLVIVALLFGYSYYKGKRSQKTKPSGNNTVK